VVAVVAHRDKLPVQAKVVAVTEPMEIVPLALVLLILVVVEVAVDMQAEMVVQAVQAALVSLSSKSHLRTMPHSHLV
jgi:hypothetical protein